MGKNPLRTGIRSLKAGSRKIRKDYNASVSRALHLAGISGAWNILLGLGKIISGLLSFSGFVCVSGFYTLGMVFARYCALAGVVQAKNVKEQYRYYRLSGSILIVASLLYMAYSGWAYYHPKYTAYPKYIALAIATFTFTEIALNIRGVLVNRKNGTLLVHALKTINLAASLLSLVLTQSAILSIAQGEYHNPSSNALLGLLAGGAAALLGVFMRWRIRRIEAENNRKEEEETSDSNSCSG